MPHHGWPPDRPGAAGLLLLWLAASALLVVASGAGAGFANRYGRNPCTLYGSGGACQVSSALGNSDADWDTFAGLYMLLGEANCTVTLQNCRKNLCYSWRDLTILLPTDVGIVQASSGFFRNLTVLSGASGVRVSREGLAFSPTSSNVVIQYSTRTCADFWSLHGGVGQQFCNQPISAITVIDADTPNALDCA